MEAIEYLTESIVNEQIFGNSVFATNWKEAESLAAEKNEKVIGILRERKEITV